MPPGLLAVSEAEIGTDLTGARAWATRAAGRIQSYARYIRFQAAEGRIRSTWSSLHCPLVSNFNIDPAVESATDYAVKLLRINSKLSAIKSTLDGLSHTDFRNTTHDDRRCEAAGAFVINKSKPVYLCGGYWLDIYHRVPTLIHEAAHLEQLSDSQYLQNRTASLPRPGCTPYMRFTLDRDTTVGNPDSYAYLCSDLRPRTPTGGGGGSAGGGSAGGESGGSR